LVTTEGDSQVTTDPFNITVECSRAVLISEEPDIEHVLELIDDEEKLEMKINMMFVTDHEECPIKEVEGTLIRKVG
jgi:hypothetical protein